MLSPHPTANVQPCPAYESDIDDILSSLTSKRFSSALTSSNIEKVTGSHLKVL